MSISNEDDITRGLAVIDALEPSERRAFLGLFAGARRSWSTMNDGAPMIGKAECEWVDDWRDFYGKRLVDADLFTFVEGDAYPLPGAIEKAPGVLVRFRTSAWACLA